MERRPYIPKFAWIDGEVVQYTEKASLKNAWQSFPAHRKRFSDSQYLGIGVDFEEAVGELIEQLEKHFNE